jgi:chaperonin cofactor prefoldin
MVTSGLEKDLEILDLKMQVLHNQSLVLQEQATRISAQFVKLKAVHDAAIESKKNLHEPVASILPQEVIEHIQH